MTILPSFSSGKHVFILCIITSYKWNSLYCTSGILVPQVGWRRHKEDAGVLMKVSQIGVVQECGLYYRLAVFVLTSSQIYLIDDNKRLRNITYCVSNFSTVPRHFCSNLYDPGAQGGRTYVLLIVGWCGINRLYVTVCVGEWVERTL